MTEYNIAVVGAGAVGQEMLRVLAERQFPARSVKVLARTARMLTVDGREYQVEPTTPEAFDGVHIALFAGTEGERGAAVLFGPEAVKRGAVAIDNGADFRMRPDVPLVVPEVNAAALQKLVLALKPLHDFARITRVWIATYQAVSGAGAAAVDELNAQNAALAAGRAVTQAGPAFPVQIAANVIPQIGGFDKLGYTSEEMKLVHETRKIMGEENLWVTPIVAARVPVVVGHSEAVSVETERPVTPAEARALWANAPGLAVLDEQAGNDPYRAYPTPLFAAGKDTTYIGRIRQDLDNLHGLNFWIVSDNLRKGAATNAVQIAESLVAQGLLGKK